MYGKRNEAWKAYQTGDVVKSKNLHAQYIQIPDEGGEPHTDSGKYIKSIVYGGLDGIITTFAIVSGVAGAKLPLGIVVIMGFSNLLADAISMGMGDYLSSKAQVEYEKGERDRELWECDNNLEAEKQEMIDIYQKRGMSNEDAVQVVELLSKHKEIFVDVMMVEELGIIPPDESESPAKNGGVTFGSFIGFGCVPLFAYIITLSLGMKTEPTVVFAVASSMAAITMFALGAVTSRFTTQKWWKAGFYMVANGLLAATAAYFVGEGLSYLVKNA